MLSTSCIIKTHLTSTASPSCRAPTFQMKTPRHRGLGRLPKVAQQDPSHQAQVHAPNQLCRTSSGVLAGLFAARPLRR